MEKEGDVFVVLKATFLTAPTNISGLGITTTSIVANQLPRAPNPNPIPPTYTPSVTPTPNFGINQAASKEALPQTQAEFVWKRSEKPLIRRE